MSVPSGRRDGQQLSSLPTTRTETTGSLRSRRPRGLSALVGQTYLPDELLAHIFSFLASHWEGCAYLALCAKVSRDWRRVAGQEGLWCLAYHARWTSHLYDWQFYREQERVEASYPRCACLYDEDEEAVASRSVSWRALYERRLAMESAWFARDFQVTHMGSHTSPVIAVDVLPDGAMAVSGCMDGRIGVWDLDWGTVGDVGIRRFHVRWVDVHTTPILSLGWIENQAVVSVGFEPNNTPRVWNARSGEVMFSLELPNDRNASCVAAVPGGSHIVLGDAGDDALYLFSATDGNHLTTLHAPQATGSLSGILSLTRVDVWEGDGCFVASGHVNTSHVLRLWDLERGACVRHWSGGSDDGARCVDSAGNLLVAGIDDKNALLYDLRMDRDAVGTLQMGGYVNGLQLQETGQRLVACVSRGAAPFQVWDLRYPKRMTGLMGGAAEGLNCFRVSGGDGRHMVTGHRSERGSGNLVKLWEVNESFHNVDKPPLHTTGEGSTKRRRYRWRRRVMNLFRRRPIPR